MSRREFRAQVSAPRPSSAWLLVAVASASLWITDQLDPWVLAVQPLLLLATLTRRTRPFGWQRSPLALNVGMFAIVSVTIGVALRGGPSTIALAHFASLTQALQLLDARPRRTEFMLVALALFQVVLAANLTDSPLFPALLVAFLFAAVWTLLVHTLRSESLEAGESHSLGRAFTPGLLRMTLLASGLSLLLALLLFVLLPRLRSSVIEGSALGNDVATAGFSDQVELGELGRIRQDATVVMRVETLDGQAPEAAQAYWRGLAFDRFDGRSWAISPGRRPIPGSPEGGIGVGPDPTVNLVQRIVREPVEAGVLFGVGDVRGLQGTIRRVERDRNGGLYALAQHDVRLRYTVASLDERPSARELERDRAAVPRRDGERYLQLPPGGERVGRLAREITEGLGSDAQRILALEAHLLSQGRYTDTPPGVAATGEVSPVEAFLVGDMAGHCEYFASALVLMARHLGLPARLVNGFAGGRTNRIGGFVELTRSDAHAWAEVHFAEAGWVRFDATPAALRARAPAALSWSERARELASALELWWYQGVIGFDRADQIQALKRAYFAWKDFGQAARRQDEARPRSSTPWQLEQRFPWRPVLGAALALALAAALTWHWGRRRQRSSEVPSFYREALRLLERRGLERARHATAHDFAREVATALPGPPARAFADLTEAYLELRFGGRTPASPAGRLEELRAALRRRLRSG